MKFLRRNRHASSGRRRRGATAVEAALVLPVFLLFLFGILEYGRYLMFLQILTNAAREGAHYALAHTDPITIAGTTSGNANSDVTNVVNKALGGQSLSGQNVQIYASDSLGNNLGSWTNGQAGQSVCVRITGNYPTMLPKLLHMATSIPVVAQAVMRSEGN
jgi:Flp pilus assembly protein TadG